MAFVKATRRRQKMRLALQGPAGSGKTRKAAEIMHALVDPGLRFGFVDTEFGSASSYAGEPAEDGRILDFDVDEIRGNYHPNQIGKLIKNAHEAEMGALAFDSLTHFWNGPGGFLELVDQEVQKQRARGGKGDSFGAWKSIDPIYKHMVIELLSAPLHIITGLRAKTEYEKVDGEGGKGGKVRKLGLAPEIRDNFQYEMQVEGMIDMEHVLVIGKTRVDPLDGMMFRKGECRKLSEIYRKWAEAAPEAPSRDQIAEAIEQAGSPETDAIREEYLSRIASASSPEALRSFLPEMKARYADMLPLHVEQLRAAYTERSNVLKNGTAAPTAPAVPVGE